MKVSYNWLKEYVNIAETPEQLAEKLTMAGIEVEEIISTLPEFKGIVIAHVDSVQNHPNADKLSLCIVSYGSEKQDVVCGAPNVAEGQHVPFAPIGTTLPVGIKIKKAKIRGVESHGMICSEQELGLAEHSDGIWVLPQEWETGGDLYERLKAEQDYILDLFITPNRPDAMSMIGIAREIAAINGLSYKYPDFSLAESPEKASDIVDVIIDTPDGCPRYSARVIRNVKIKSSPDWMKDRLIKSGIRPINNIVDITNYVLLEFGQPLHAFDLAQIAGNKIIVRDSVPDEHFVTLDENDRKIPDQTVMICNAEKAVAIGGVMGGMNSEVSEKTVDVLLESAYFNPARISSTSKKLGLSSEASLRFERGMDPNGVIRASNRAAALMIELGDGEVMSGVVDEYIREVVPRHIKLRPERVNSLLGTTLNEAEIADVLKNLDIAYKNAEAEIPTFRPDLGREVDLIEEVARLVGFDNIPAKKQTFIEYETQLNIEDLFYDYLKTQIRELGFTEVLTNSMVSSRDLVQIDQPGVVEILNPVSDDMDVMRRSLLPGLIKTAAYNINRNMKDLRIFEMGRVFIGTDHADPQKQPYQIAGLLHGTRQVSGWGASGLPLDYFDVKGCVESFLNKIFLDNFEFILYDDNGYFEPSEVVAIHINSTPIGHFGLIKEKVGNVFDVSSPIYAFEISVPELWQNFEIKRFYKPFSRFPFVEKDVAFIVENTVHSEALLQFISETGKPLLNYIDIFDVYTGDRLAKGQKSIAFKLRFQSETRTLKDSEVNKIFNTIIKAVESAFHARLREG
jgi:phenylalanyl-tRNA synthetase beta chain